MHADPPVRTAYAVVRAFRDKKERLDLRDRMARLETRAREVCPAWRVCRDPRVEMDCPVLQASLEERVTKACLEGREWDRREIPVFRDKTGRKDCPDYLARMDRLEIQV